MYEEQLERLTGVEQEHSEVWQQQKAELEKDYGKMLAEIHTRHKVHVSYSVKEESRFQLL